MQRAGRRDGGALLPVLAMVRDFEAAHRKQFGFVFADKAIMVESFEVEAVGGGADIEEPEQALADDEPHAHSDVRIYSAGAWRTARVFLRDALKPGHAVKGPALIIEPHQTIMVEPGWQATVTARDAIVLGARRAAAQARRHRHRGRPGDARGLQQPLHVDRRTDGRRAAEHRLFGQHQGAARLLLRGLRRRRTAGRQRAAHAGPSRLHGPLGGDDHPPQRRRHPSRRRLRVERPL